MDARERQYLTDEVEVSEFPTIPAGTYLATLEGVTDEEHEKYGRRWVWHWALPDMHPDGGDYELQVWTPPRITDTGIAAEQAAALGFSNARGAKVNLGALRGRRAQLAVVFDEKAKRNRVKAATPAPYAAAPQATVTDPEYAAYLAEKAAKQAAAVAADEPPLQEPPADPADESEAA